MKFRKKLLIVIIYMSLLNIIIMFFYTDSIKDLKNTLIFKSKYVRKTVLETNLNYNDISENNIISKNNFSIQLSNLNYNKENGSLKLEFKFYTNDEKMISNIEYIIIIYDSKKIFYLNERSNEQKYAKYITKEKPYKSLDKNMIESDEQYKSYYIKDYNSEYEIQKTFELEVFLGENYNILDELNIDFWNLTYKEIDDFTSRKVIEPLGEYKFIVDVNNE